MQSTSFKNALFGWIVLLVATLGAVSILIQIVFTLTFDIAAGAVADPNAYPAGGLIGVAWLAGLAASGSWAIRYSRLRIHVKEDRGPLYAPARLMCGLTALLVGGIVLFDAILFLVDPRNDGPPNAYLVAALAIGTILAVFGLAVSLHARLDIRNGKGTRP